MKEKLIQPPFLKPKDKVAIISPSGVVDQEKVLNAILVIEAWGLEVM